jgi:sugar phosphate isomerase/epimerase
MLALTTDSLKGYGLNRIFKFVKEAGYDGVDLVIDPKNFDTQNAKFIKSLSDEIGIPVLAISAPQNANARKIKEAIDMAKILGSKIVIIQPPKIFDFKFTEWLKKEIPKIRQKENISIALENAPSKMFLGIIPEHAMGNIMDLKKFKHACIDTSRIAIKKEDLIRVYKVLKPYLVHIHLSNVKGGVPYAPPEKGILPIESFLAKLKQDGFAGTVSLKINSKFLDVGNDEKVIKTLIDQKKFYETYFIDVKVLNSNNEQ